MDPAVWIQWMEDGVIGKRSQRVPRLVAVEFSQNIENVTILGQVLEEPTVRGQLVELTPAMKIHVLSIQWMVAGDIGEPGLNVIRPVVEEPVPGADLVIIQYQPMEAESVRAIINKSRLVRLNFVQWMEGGVPGQAMVHVLSPVVLESSQEPGSVTILNQVLEEQLVWVPQSGPSNVILTHVQNQNRNRKVNLILSHTLHLTLDLILCLTLNLTLRLILDLQ